MVTAEKHNRRQSGTLLPILAYAVSGVFNSIAANQRKPLKSRRTEEGGVLILMMRGG